MSVDSRRRFLAGGAGVATGTFLLAACGSPGAPAGTALAQNFLNSLIITLGTTLVVTVVAGYALGQLPVSGRAVGHAVDPVAARGAGAGFGPRRLMFGSDWPVCLLVADYIAVRAALEAALPDLPAAHRAEIFGGTAGRVYGLRL